MRYFQYESQKAIWSQRIALSFLLLFLITFGLHRFSQIGTPVAMKLFGIAVSGAVAALVLGVAALVTIWREGHKGAGRALTGAMTGMLLLALPLWSLPDLMALPRIYEVSTDTRSPPEFQKVAAMRKGEANPVNFSAASIEEQVTAYPDLQPLTIKRSTAEAFSAVREAANTLDWKILAEKPPENGAPGTIEASDRSFIFGFTDDVVVRVTGDEKRAQIDARSSSRYGQHDLGRNAQRIRELFSEVQNRLAAIETSEQMQKAVLQREEQSKRAIKKRGNRRERAEERQGRISAAEPDRRLDDGAGTVSPPGRTRPQGSAAPGFERRLSREGVRSERRRSKRQRQRERTRALRKFWEQLGQ